MIAQRCGRRATGTIRTVLAAACLVFVASGTGRTDPLPFLVKDINTKGQGSYPNNLIEVNGALFFEAFDPVRGSQFWRSDGTAEGTTVLIPRPEVSVTGTIAKVNETLFFSGIGPGTGEELWKSDGTAAGTVLVKDINPGVDSSSPRDLADVDGMLFFVTDAPETGRYLWKTDGTSAGTVPVKEPTPREVYGLTNVNGTLFFAAYDPDHGFELWKSDGTAAGTVRVKDINPGIADGFPRDLTNVDGTLFFSASDGVNGVELWKSDGTADGTILVGDIVPGDQGSSPHLLIPLNGMVFFRFGPNGSSFEFTLWRSDGTEGGTVPVTDVNGTTLILNRDFHAVRLDGTLIFTAFAGGSAELWKTDGTPTGTVMVKDIAPGTGSSDPQGLIVANGTVFFSASAPGYGRELWRSNGSEEGTVLVADINPGPGDSSPGTFVDVTGTLYFPAFDVVAGRELWMSDGTAAGTVRVTDINLGTEEPTTPCSGPHCPFPPPQTDPPPQSLTNANGRLFFSAFDPLHGQELWTSNGTGNGTVLVKDVNPGETGSSPDSLAEVNGTLFFSASDATTGTELWKTDGTAAGTVMIKDLVPGSYGGVPTQFTAVNGTVVFAAFDATKGNELWKTDGTATGTVLLKDIYEGEQSLPSELTNVNGTVFFSARDAEHGRELWKTDGTAPGTILVKDIALLTDDPSLPPFFSGSFPEGLTDVDGTLFFSADDGVMGMELWKSDGTTEGTVLVKDIDPGDSSSLPGSLAVVGGTLFFSAGDRTNGRELWKSDGTESGTVLVRDINPGGVSSEPRSLTVVNGKLFFGALDPATGEELWISDGTTDGTVLVKDISPGSASTFGFPEQRMTSFGGRLFFQACEAVHGCALWQSDGTASGTVPVADIGAYPPGRYPQDPSSLTSVNGTLFFSATEPFTGYELWALTSCGNATDGFEPEGTPCPDDGSPCSVDACDGKGVCQHLPIPQSGCRSAVRGKGILRLRDASADKKDRLNLKWTSTGSTSKDDFGNPRGTTQYTLCLYDTAPRIALEAPAGHAGWTKRAKGFQYDAEAGGLRRLALKVGRRGMARITVKGGGPGLGLSPLPLSSPVTIQLKRGGSDVCWQASFGSAFLNNSRRYRAKPN